MALAVPYDTEVFDVQTIFIFVYIFRRKSLAQQFCTEQKVSIYIKVTKNKLWREKGRSLNIKTSLLKQYESLLYKPWINTSLHVYTYWSPVLILIVYWLIVTFLGKTTKCHIAAIRSYHTHQFLMITACYDVSDPYTTTVIWDFMEDQTRAHIFISPCTLQWSHTANMI